MRKWPRTFSQLLAAQCWLYRATVELDRSNGDLANHDLQMAGSILRRIDPASAHIDPVRLEVLQEGIATTSMSKTADRLALRCRILHWVKQVGELLPGQVAQGDVGEVENVGPARKSTL